MVSAPVIDGLHQALLRLAETRDAEAWGFLLERVGPDIQRLISRLTGDEALAEDAVQETLLLVRDHAGRFRQPSANPDAAARRWILGVAVNVSANLVRKQQRFRKRQIAAHQPPPKSKPPEEQMERDEQADALRLALAELPNRRRVAIVLHHIVGLGFPEVAAELRCPVGTAKTHVHRGLEGMRKYLQRFGISLSLAAVVGSLQELPAATVSIGIAAKTALLAAPIKASSSAALSSSFSGATIAMKISIAAAAIVAVTVGARSLAGADGLAVSPENTWVKLSESATGGRSSAMFFYEPGERKFYLMGGVFNGDRHFDVEIFDPGAKAWTNAYPKGAPYKNAAGVTDAPKCEGASAILQDIGGITRMCATSMYEPYATDTRAHFQWSYAADTKQLLAHVYNKTLSYAVGERKWTDTGAKPFAQGSLPMVWGNMCYDPVNKEIVSIGGSSAEQGGTPGTWIYKIADKTWSKLDPGSRALKGLHAKSTALRRQAWALLSLCRSRYFLTESEGEAKATLSVRAAELANATQQFADEAKAAKLAGAESQAGKRAADLSAAALVVLKGAAGKIDGEMTPAVIAEVKSMHDQLELAEFSLAPEPSGRAHAQPAFDAEHKKIVLFGGNGLDRCYADTWIYDCKSRTWEQRYPEFSPSPRGGHAMIYLPKSKQVALIGGYVVDGGVNCQYVPHQVWTYEVSANSWKLLISVPGQVSWDPQPGVPRGEPHGNYASASSPWLGAATADDVVVMIDTGTPGRITWGCAIDPSKADAGTEKLGVAPGTMQSTLSPTAYEQPGNKPQPAKTADFYKNLPVNRWTLISPPTGVEARVWGTTAYDPDRQQFLYWGGGHVTYMATDVAHGSVRGNCWTLGYAPDLPLEPCGGFGVKVSRTFQDRPSIPIHSYRGYAYDPPSGKMFVCNSSYDVAERQWDVAAFPGLQCEGTSKTLLETTPAGVVAVSKYGLFRFEWKDKAWKKLPVNGPGFDSAWCDGHALCYDAEHDCLWNGTDKIYRYDIKTGKSEEIAVKRPARLREWSLWEEQIAIPHTDLILLMRRFPGADGKDTNVAFDTKAKKYYAVDLPFSDGQPHNFDWTSALVYDAKLDAALLHAPGKDDVWALRLDRKILKMTEITE